jgi:MoxR-like ATPase
MSTDNCSCEPKTDFPKRSARSGVVLHEHRTGGVVILLAAIAPRTWRALVGNPEGWKVGKFDVGKAPSYHGATRGVTYPLKSPVWDSIEDAVNALPDSIKVAPGQLERAFAAAQVEYDRSPRSEVPPMKDPFIDPIDTLAPSGRILTPEELRAKKEEILATLKGVAAAKEAEELASAKSTTGYVPRAKAAAASSEFNPPPVNPDRYWYESERDMKFLGDFVQMRLAGHETNAIVVGPSGFGKTEGVIRLGERLGVPVHVINCQVITTPDKWLGQMQADPEKGTFFEVSQHLRWVERTHEDCIGAEFCIMCYDELTRLRPELGNMTFSLLDGQQGLEVPQMGRRVAMSDKNVVFATANIGSAYAGTFAMDWALRGRFDSTLERGFPPEDEELKVITTANAGLTDDAARQIIKVAQHTRTLWKNGELESPISTRLLLSWARYVAGGYTIKDAAEYTVTPVYTEDGGAESDRAKVKLAIDGKVR